MRIRRVSTKFLGVLGTVVVVASVATGWFVVSSAEDALLEQTRAQLEAERASRARFFSLYLRRLNQQLGISSRQLVTQLALRDLRADSEKLRALFHPYATGLIEAFGYSNVVLADNDGIV